MITCIIYITKTHIHIYIYIYHMGIVVTSGKLPENFRGIIRELSSIENYNINNNKINI